jgi:hypothetical protein
VKEARVKSLLCPVVTPKALILEGKEEFGINQSKFNL